MYFFSAIAQAALTSSRIFSLCNIFSEIWENLFEAEATFRLCSAKIKKKQLSWILTKAKADLSPHLIWHHLDATIFRKLSTKFSRLLPYYLFLFRLHKNITFQLVFMTMVNEWRKMASQKEMASNCQWWSCQKNYRYKKNPYRKNYRYKKNTFVWNFDANKKGRVCLVFILFQSFFFNFIAYIVQSIDHFISIIFFNFIAFFCSIH